MAQPDDSGWVSMSEFSKPPTDAKPQPSPETGAKSSASPSDDGWVPMSAFQDTTPEHPPISEEDHQQRVSSYQDRANKFVEDNPAIMSGPKLQIPIIHDVANKAAAFVNSYLPGNEDLYGTNASDRYKNMLAFGSDTHPIKQFLQRLFSLSEHPESGQPSQLASPKAPADPKKLSCIL